MSFREATGNYEKDKYSPIIEAVINIGTSIVLAKYLGIAGVVLGTIISCLCTNFWWEPLIITKKSLTITLKDYFIMYAKYTIVGTIVGLVTILLSSIIPDRGMLWFILRSAVAFLIPTILLLIIYRKNENILYYKDLLKQKIKNVL